MIGSRTETDDTAKAQRAARLRANDEAFLTRIRGMGIEPGTALNGKTAERVLHAYYATHGMVQDRWGNWRPGAVDAPVKYGIKARTVTKEENRPDLGWVKTRSWGLIDLAAGYITAAAKNVGDIAAQAAAAVKDERKAAQGQADKKRLRMRALEIAKKRLNKRALARIRDEGLLDWVDANPDTARANARVKAILEEIALDEYAEQMRVLQDLQRDGHPPEEDDGADWSLDAPPRPWLDGNFYRWNEDGYTIRIDGEDKERPGTTPFLIGHTTLGFDPVGFKLDWRGRFMGGEGKGWLGGTILHPRNGKPPLVVITTVGNNERETKGVGRTLVTFAARLARGWGNDQFHVHAITDEGRPFWDHLERTGELVRLREAPNGDRLYRIGTIGARRQSRPQASTPTSSGKPSLLALLQKRTK